MSKKDLKAAWLASNAVVAFVGALIFGQSWQQPDQTSEPFFNLPIPDFSDIVYVAIMAFLFVLSLVFAIASLILTMSQVEAMRKLWSWVSYKAKGLFLTLGQVEAMRKLWSRVSCEPKGLFLMLEAFLGAFVWLAFLLSLLYAFPEFPDDQWWAPILTWGGIVMVFLFIPFQMIIKPIFKLAREESRKPHCCKQPDAKPKNSVGNDSE